MAPDLWRFEREAKQQGFSVVAGIDEAGRGPLAGPVVSAAVILPKTFAVTGINDSKKLTPKKRADLFEKIRRYAAAVGTGIVDAAEIDRLNIHRASLLSMTRSLENMGMKPDLLLIDGPFKISSEIPQRPIPKGDSLSISIAAASIVAKVTRDRLMERYHALYPQFDFARHKGYPTKAHREAILKYGCCPIHRQTFRGVREQP